MSDTSQLHRVVIVGGGAGGLELATKLGKKYGKKRIIDITLVDASLTHIWKPLLHEVASGRRNPGEDEVSYLAHARANHFRFRLGRLESLDRANRIVTMSPIMDEDGREMIPRRQFAYDTLVISIGSVTNSFGTPGVEENCVFLDSRKQADRFHRRLLNTFLRAHSRTGELEEGQLNVVIIGAGATGIELAAELHNTARQVVAYGLDKISPDRDVKLTIVEAGPTILPALPARISSGVLKQLRHIGVEVMTDVRVTEVVPEGLKTASGEFIPAAIKVWAAGIKGADVLSQLDGLETNRINQLVVKPTLQTTGDENIFAFGDCASCPRAGHDRPVPPRAQAAHQQASLLVKSIGCILNDQPLPEYVYKDHGSLVSLSEHVAFGNLMGNLTGDVMVSGRLARVIYVSLYRMHLTAVNGFLPTTLKVFTQWLTGRLRPALKLH